MFSRSGWFHCDQFFRYCLEPLKSSYLFVLAEELTLQLEQLEEQAEELDKKRQEEKKPVILATGRL